MSRAPLVVAFGGLLAACGGGDPLGFDTPESVVHDARADVWLISNIHGAPLAKDGNGYLSRLDPDGAFTRRWIAGGRNGVVLHAPKGLALAGDLLWVADIDVLRAFDRATGAPRGEVAIPGAAFLNDVSAAPDGAIWCTDTGLDAQFQPTGTDAIWRVGPDRVPQAIARGAALGQPNGLVATATGAFVVNWRDGAFFQVDGKGRRTDLGKAPAAQLDGLVRIDTADGGVFLATSWAGRCVYRFDRTGACTALPVPLDQPADCGFDAQRGLLLVPLFGKNALERISP